MAESCPFFVNEFGKTPNEAWFKALKRFTKAEILNGYRGYLDSGYRGVPSLSQFIEWCKPVVKSPCQQPLKSIVYEEPSESNKAAAKTFLNKIKGKL